MLHIEKEIAEQPEVIRRLLDEETGTAERIAQAIREYDPAFVMIAARGTSDNAARYAQYLWGTHNSLPVALATPSVHTLYKAQPNLSRALVIGISQSGQSTDVGQVVADAKGQGALTVTITNDEESPMAKMADYHLPLRCGEGSSVAATKTYTAQLVAIAMLAAALKTDSGMQAELQKLPDYVAHTLELSGPVRDWVQRYRYIESMAVIGRGYNYSTAFEISIKIKELCYVTCEEYSEADFRHGPIAIIQPGFPVIVVAPSGKPFELMRDLLGELNKRRAECLVISDDASLEEHAQYFMRLPVGLPEWLSPVCAVIPGQIFAKNLALIKGHSVDRPEGLTKVTFTQ
jgi:glutamine---fructose-6-phosphate transaminase (isomerizing)